MSKLFFLFFFLYILHRVHSRLLRSRGTRRRASGLRLFLAETIFLELTHEGDLVGDGLEATMSELGAGVDEFEIDLLQRGSLRVYQQGL